MKIKSIRYIAISLLFNFAFYVHAEEIDLDEDLELSSDIEESNKPYENKEKDKAEKAEEEKVERIRQILKYGSSSQVRDIVKKIEKLHEDNQKSLMKELRDLMKVDSILIRQKIIELIKNVKWKDLDKEIIPFLNHEDSDLVFLAAQTLIKKKPDGAAEAASKVIEKSDFEKNDNGIIRLLSLLSVYKYKELNDFLLKKVKEDTIYRNNKTAIIRHFGGVEDTRREIVEYLETLLQEEGDELVRGFAANSLGKIKEKSSIDILRNTLSEINSKKDPDEIRKHARLKMHIIGALIRLGDTKIAPILVEMTRDDHDGVRLRAIRYLGELKLTEYKDLLEFKAKYDTNAKVKKEAEKALEKMGFAAKQENGT
ncbi:MAG: HEAT repeat domain-containing protein [Spirochaetia bacterium]|nr:HEAT repeat domain-containing protein [Spirochaetia bacterium]